MSKLEFLSSRLMQTNTPDVFTTAKGDPEEPMVFKKNNRQSGE